MTKVQRAEHGLLVADVGFVVVIHQVVSQPLHALKRIFFAEIVILFFSWVGVFDLGTFIDDVFPLPGKL